MMNLPRLQLTFRMVADQVIITGLRHGGGTTDCFPSLLRDGWILGLCEKRLHMPFQQIRDQGLKTLRLDVERPKYKVQKKRMSLLGSFLV